MNRSWVGNERREPKPDEGGQWQQGRLKEVLEETRNANSEVSLLILAAEGALDDKVVGHVHVAPGRVVTIVEGRVGRPVVAPVGGRVPEGRMER